MIRLRIIHVEFSAPLIYSAFMFFLSRCFPELLYMYKYVLFEHQKIHHLSEENSQLFGVSMITDHNVRIVEVHGIRQMLENLLNETLQGLPQFIVAFSSSPAVIFLPYEGRSHLPILALVFLLPKGINHRYSLKFVLP